MTHSLTPTEICESGQKNANLDARILKFRTLGLGLTVRLHSLTLKENVNVDARILKLKT